MELDWTTFVLEIINFLVLVWILKRFLYQPVLSAIATRRAGIEAKLAEAQKQSEAAQSLQQQYEHRLSDWEKERAQARKALSEDIERMRREQLLELKQELAREQEKAQVLHAKQQEDSKRKLEKQALEEGAHFASRLLEQGAGPNTEERLIDLAISGLAKLSKERLEALRIQLGKGPASARVISAYPLSQKQQQQIEKQLAHITESDVIIEYAQDKSLVAGLKINIGAWILAMNIQDELEGFVHIDA